MQADIQERRQRAERIETLIQEVSAFPDPRTRATTEELIQALLDMYGEGLARMLEITSQTEAAGYSLIEAFAQDELLSSLFMLHGLHPVDIEMRIAKALAEVRPYLQSHGGNVELVRVEDGIAHLRLQGSCHGCPSSTMTLKLTIEEAIYKAAPDLDSLEVEGVSEPRRPGIPVTFVPPRRHKNSAHPTEQENGWQVVEGLEALGPGTLKLVDVQGFPLLFFSIVGTYYAYSDHCSGCNASLATGRLEGASLICSSCGRHYDVCRAGRCLDAPDLFLEPVPLLMESGKVKVALPALAKDDQSHTVLSAPIK